MIGKRSIAAVGRRLQRCARKAEAFVSMMRSVLH
jgi:hypothetical protein